jgi:hypothetical protein
MIAVFAPHLRAPRDRPLSPPRKNNSHLLLMFSPSS